MKNPILYLITCFFILAGCSNTGIALQEDNSYNAPEAFLVTDFREFSGSAPVGIENITISKNLISIHIKYSGGCNEHLFQLIGHKMITNGSPPERNVRLFHNNNEDSCREIIQDVLVFNISALAYLNKETVLKIDGYRPKVTYTPVN